MFSLISSLFLLSLPMMLGDEGTCPDAGNAEEITVAEALDIQDWLLVEETVETTLYGTWENDDSSKFSIHPLPLSSNTCLVEVDSRLVPGFVFALGDQRFLAVGANASEQLQLKPTVYRYSFGETGNSLTFTKVDFGGENDAFSGIDALSRIILSQKEWTSTQDGNLNFHRI